MSISRNNRGLSVTVTYGGRTCFSNAPENGLISNNLSVVWWITEQYDIIKELRNKGNLICGNWSMEK